MLVLKGSQIVDLPPSDLGDAALEGLLEPYKAYGDSLGLEVVPRVSPQSISINLTSSCNLACTYCYADRGSFSGRQEGNIGSRHARAAVAALLRGSDRGARATIGFLGGEPLLERRLMHEIVEHAAEEARAAGQPIGFSITTNGTILDGSDIDLFRRHVFAVTISIDGSAETHDRRRLSLAGRPTHANILERVKPLLADSGTAIVSARATVTRDHLHLVDRHDALQSVGFKSIGLSPVRVGHGALGQEDWAVWQSEKIRLGERELARVLAGGETAFDNLRVALRQIHRGFSSPYPCGAGGGYFSVSTGGTWYACHRAIGDERYEMGSNDGLLDDRRREFLTARHVDSVPGCHSCWARYLCGGACHQEASARNKASCDSIRAWLEFCLDAYCTISTSRPDWLTFRRTFDGQ